MKRKSFVEFLDKKRRDEMEQLRLVEKVLRSKGLHTENHLDDLDDPYVYCHSPQKGGQVGGIRIYKIADVVAFRVQRESRTHPYGRAYLLEIEEMFEDLLADDTKPEEAAAKVANEVAVAVRRFFEKSSQAEQDEREQQLMDLGDGAGRVAMRSQGTDYSSLIYTRGN